MAKSKKAQRLKEAEIILQRLRSWSSSDRQAYGPYWYDYPPYGYGYDYRTSSYMYGYRSSPYSYGYQAYSYGYDPSYSVGGSQGIALRSGERVVIRADSHGRQVLTVSILPSGEVEVRASGGRPGRRKGQKKDRKKGKKGKKRGRRS